MEISINDRFVVCDIFNLHLRDKHGIYGQHDLEKQKFQIVVFSRFFLAYHRFGFGSMQMCSFRASSYSRRNRKTDLTSDYHIVPSAYTRRRHQTG